MIRTVPDATVQLDRLGRGELDPAASLPVVRSALSGDDTLAGRLYVAFRDLVWRTLVAQEFSDDLVQWHDLLSHSVALSRKRQHSFVAERLQVLAELVSQSARFNELQPAESVLERKHVVELLQLLATSGGEVPRSDIARRLRLADANLSRILTLLTVNRLVLRTQSGKHAAFSLTETGRQAASKAAGERGVHLDVDAVPVPLGIWSTAGKCIAMNRALRDLSQSVGLNGAVDSPRQDWWEALQNAAVERVAGGGNGAFEVRMPEGRWLQCTVTRTSDHEICTVMDLTHTKARQAELEGQVRELGARASRLELDLASFKHRAAMYGSVARRARDDMMEMTAHANRDLQVILHDPSFSHGDNLAVVGNYLAAANFAARDVLVIPDPLRIEERRHHEQVDIAKLLQDTAERFRFAWGAQLALKINKTLPMAWAYSPIDTAMTQVLYALLPYSMVGIAQLTIQATIEKRLKRLILKVERSFRSGPGESLRQVHSPVHMANGEFEDLRVVLEDLGVELDWDGAGPQSQSVRVHVPISF
jgi:PAS domain-containing protein